MKYEPKHLFQLRAKGIKMSGKSSYLVNLNPDPALSELLVYNLPDEGDAFVGSGESSYIKLLSFGIAEHHATINVSAGIITLIPMPTSLSCINGAKIELPAELKSGDRLLWGSNHYFRLTIPGAKITTPANESVCDFEAAQREVFLHQLPEGAQETLRELENQINDDDGNTTVITGLSHRFIVSCRVGSARYETRYICSSCV